eukprot:CAMPEP_0194495688 /NCGR_PEP_ID=MMETSP0253-20130528/13203_1 /TAXON_ID=2966 /ORGANISM="Noctiluca scintillans" /LENGTH=167 /DNA_ID=CAMNT_0039336981 /DNA_START=39 /DNA_END=543 /DNA_ORIENTATION=-
MSPPSVNGIVPPKPECDVYMTAIVPPPAEFFLPAPAAPSKPKCLLPLYTAPRPHVQKHVGAPRRFEPEVCSAKVQEESMAAKESSPLDMSMAGVKLHDNALGRCQTLPPSFLATASSTSVAPCKSGCQRRSRSMMRHTSSTTQACGAAFQKPCCGGPAVIAGGVETM